MYCTLDWRVFICCLVELLFFLLLADIEDIANLKFSNIVNMTMFMKNAFFSALPLIRSSAFMLFYFIYEKWNKCRSKKNDWVYMKLELIELLDILGTANALVVWWLVTRWQFLMKQPWTNLGNCWQNSWNCRVILLIIENLMQIYFCIPCTS